MDGGPAGFTQRLNTLLDPTNRLADLGNEPSFGTPYLYNFVNQQPLSVKVSRYVGRTLYTPGPGGLPGNSDAGAMQSWLLWNMIGLYPLTGQTTFLIHSPWFTNLTIWLGNNKTLRITSTGGTVAGHPSDAIYVQSLKVNGEAWNQNWLTWYDVFADGGTMDFVLGTAMMPWDAQGAPPPSPASAGNQTGAKPANYAAQVAKAMRTRKLRKIGIGVGAVSVVVLVIFLAVLAFCVSQAMHRRRAEKELKANAAAVGEEHANGRLDFLPAPINSDEIQEVPRRRSLDDRGDGKSDQRSVIMVQLGGILDKNRDENGTVKNRAVLNDGQESSKMSS
jgi:hypothetical protein